MRSNGNSQILTVRLYGGQHSFSQDVLLSKEVEAYTVRVPSGTEWHVQPGITFTYRPNDGRPWWYLWRSWYPKIYLTALRVSEPKETAHLGIGEVSLKIVNLMLRARDKVTIVLPEMLMDVRGG